MRVVEHRPTIWTIHDAVSEAECRELITLAESEGFGPAPITTAFGFVMRPDIRNNGRVILDNNERANWLYQLTEAALPASWDERVIAGLNERLRFYRYDPGQYFDWHYDGAFERDDSESSELTFMLYLNDDFEGGETSFVDFEIKPETGMILIFKHRLLHRGSEVVSGRKYVLRSDVMYRDGPLGLSPR